MLRTFLALVLAVALGAAPWSLSVAAALDNADTNGDRAVDILDIQRAIACALDGDSASLDADVNGDGVVDVRDVQRIMSQATQTSEPEEKEAPANPDAVVPAPVLLLAAFLHTSHRPVELPDSSFTVSEYSDAGITPPLNRLMLGGRSPHAPPACA